jgi:hypothetical protein
MSPSQMLGAADPSSRVTAVATAGMTGDPRGLALARFWERRGYAVFEAAGALWGRYSRLYHVSFPFQIPLDPAPGELDGALRRARVLAARYPARSGAGAPGGLFVCEAHGFSLARLDATHRKHVRQGLNRCEIRSVGPDELLSQGLALNLATLRRQGRFDPELCDPPRWARFVAATSACPEISVLGAFVERRLSAYVVSCRDARWVHCLFKASRPEDLRLRTNPALEFTLLQRAAQDPTIEAVTAGVVAPGDALCDRYKEGMGYRLLPQRVAVHVHPSARRLLTSAAAVAALEVVSRLLPRNARWRVVSATMAAARASRRPGRRGALRPHGCDAGSAA